MINVKQLMEHVVRPVLVDLSEWRPGVNTLISEYMMLFTALVESELKHIHQLGDGPAVGLWQVEPFTHDDLWNTYISRHPDLAEILKSYVPTPTAEAMHGNLYYNCAISRIKYVTIPHPFPTEADLPEMAEYWAKYYNTKNLERDKIRFVNLASMYG